MVCSRRHSGRAASWRAGLGALAMLLTLPAAAAAADFPALRGSFTPGYMRWDGIVLGATLGDANMSTDFSETSGSIVSNMLRNSTLDSENHISDWSVLSNDVSGSTSYGGFIGYNKQWDQIVLGLDLAYHRFSNLQTSDSSSLRRVASTSDGTSHDVTVTAQSSEQLVDYGTFRLRAGYAFGQFLPYAMIGGALGRFNYSTSVSLSDTQTDSNGVVYSPLVFPTQTDAKDNAYAAGLAVGLGLDVAVLPNVFLRAEWEYVTFGTVNGINSYMNNGRVGVGVRF